MPEFLGFIGVQALVAVLGILWCAHGFREEKLRYVIEGVLLLAITAVVTVLYVWKVLP